MLPTRAAPALTERCLDDTLQARLRKQGIVPRRFWYTQEFKAWCGSGLAEVVVTKMWGDNVPSARQLSSLIRRFQQCERLHVPSTLRCLHPHELGVWEIKSGDVRIFGWFARFDVFVAHHGGDTFTIKDEQLYDEEVAEVVNARNRYGSGFIGGCDERNVLTL